MKNAAIKSIPSENRERLTEEDHEAPAKTELLFAKAAGFPEPVFETIRPIAHAYATIKDLCRELKVSKATINRLCRRGLPFTIVGSRKRFDLVAVRRWLEGGSLPDTSQVQTTRRISTNDLRTFGFERRSA